MCAANANCTSSCLTLESCHIQYFTSFYAALTCWLCSSSFCERVCSCKDNRGERLVTVTSKLGYNVNRAESCFTVSVTDSLIWKNFLKTLPPYRNTAQRKRLKNPCEHMKMKRGKAKQNRNSLKIHHPPSLEL